MKCPRQHKPVDEFWRVWQEVGEPGKHGVYESTWLALDAALKAIKEGEDQLAESVANR